MKRKLSIVLTLLLSMAMLASCGNSIKVPDEYKYDDLTEYITLGEYKGLEYDAADLTVTRHQVEAEIDKIREQFKTTKKETSGTVNETCTANIDYSGSMDGKKFDGGTATGYDLDIDNSNFIEGFAEALVGHKVGETFDINVTFPEDYGSADLAGKPAVFTITVNYINQDVLPAYTDEFVKENTDFASKSELEASVEEELKNQAKADATAKAKSDLFEKVKSASKVAKYPDAELALRNDSYGDEDMAKSTVKQELILNQIARIEGIELTDKDYQEYLDKLLADSGYTPDTFKEQTGSSIEEYAAENFLFTSLLYQRVMDKVLEYSVERG
ncbi:MAG: FKBP-type peptidyl-prolyl cis-trans isomerase [Clostridiales bacterium]|nr:FKBP-type peptidyl-prolyl cis-trans isomerase [Candidatus Crickella equi]